MVIISASQRLSFLIAFDSICFPIMIIITSCFLIIKKNFIVIDAPGAYTICTYLDLFLGYFFILSVVMVRSACFSAIVLDILYRGILLELAERVLGP